MAPPRRLRAVRDGARSPPGRPRSSSAPPWPAPPRRPLPPSTSEVPVSAEKRAAQEALKKKLTPEQFHVTQECGTEPPFRNAYWDNHEPGIYVDVVSGEPLFSSLDKFDSGTGWPSFTRPLERRTSAEKRDVSHGMVRIEVRSQGRRLAPRPRLRRRPARPGGLRYCINSASLRFVPAARLEAEGYGAYASVRARAGAPGGGQGRRRGRARPTAPKEREVALLAGGCFWGMEDILRKIPGVLETEVGYTGGWLENPTYDDTHDCEVGPRRVGAGGLRPAGSSPTRTCSRSGSSACTTRPRQPPGQRPRHPVPVRHLLRGRSRSRRSPRR